MVPEIEEGWNSEVADGFSDRGSSGRVLVCGGAVGVGGGEWHRLRRLDRQ